MSKITIKLEIEDAHMPRLVDAIERIARVLERPELEEKDEEDSDLDEYLLHNGIPE